jgi:hypothetical protein
MTVTIAARRSELMQTLKKCAATIMVLMPATALGATPKLAPGLWEVTSKTEMVGMAMQMPAHTMKTCLKADELAQPWKQFQSAGQDCSFSDMEMNAHSAHWKMRCSSAEGNITGSGSSEFVDPHHFHGMAHMEMKANGTTMQMKIENKGRWVAASCDE